MFSYDIIEQSRGMNIKDILHGGAYTMQRFDKLKVG